MKKVLLVTSTEDNYPTFAYQCKKVFSKLGYKQKTFNFRKYHFNVNKITNWAWNKWLLMTALKENPNFVLVDKGNSIIPGIVKKITDAGIKVANWNMDEPFGQYNKVDKVENIDEYDAFFIFDPYYLPKLKKINPNSYFLPCFADPTIHKEMVPVSKRKYIADVSFIGSHRKSRQKLMESISEYKQTLHCATALLY